MSTRAIREALERLAKLDDGCSPVTLRALLEVQRIEKAAKTATRLNMGDMTYNIRETEAVMKWADETGRNSWEAPDVKAWSDASQVLKSIAKDAPP